MNNYRLSTSGLKSSVITEEERNYVINLLPKYEEKDGNRVNIGTNINIKGDFILYVKDASNIIVKHSSYQSAYRATGVSKHYIKKLSIQTRQWMDIIFIHQILIIDDFFLLKTILTINFKVTLRERSKHPLINNQTDMKIIL